MTGTQITTPHQVRFTVHMHVDDELVELFAFPTKAEAHRVRDNWEKGCTTGRRWATVETQHTR